MADVGLRDREFSGTGGRREEPTITPAASNVVPLAPVKTARPGAADAVPAGTVDALGIDATIAQIAELAVHGATRAPMTIALLGPAGSGKSFALGRLAARIRDLAAAAGSAQGPFLGRVHVQAIDAAALDGDIPTTLAARLHAGLRDAYPELARDIAQSARDPHEVLRETNEKLDDARRRLDSERRALDDAGSRRARLVETVLYEASGSQVDAYARANRAGIESRLAGFGIAGEPIRAYKDFVQFVAGSGGKVGLAQRSLWGFKGQAKLVVAAIVLVAIGIGIGIAIDDQSRWLAELRTNAQAGMPVANWFQDHMELVGTAKTATFALAALCLVANLWRAAGFLTPIFKGARLLAHDLDARRRDLDGLYAHQTKRVDALDADVERLTREASEAERRAGGNGSATASMPSPFEPTSGASQAAAQAQRFFAELTRAIAAGRTATDGKAPHRIVVALDHLDAVEPARARAILDVLHRMTGGAIVTALAADVARLDPDGSRRGDLERWIDVPVALETGGFGERDYGALVRAALGKAPAKPVAAPAIDPRASGLDRAVGDAEAEMLAVLAKLAGDTPRAVTRFVACYRLARLDDGVRQGALALGLALRSGGTPAERSCVAAAMADGDPSAMLAPEGVSPRLSAALQAAAALDGGRITAGEAATAARRAALFSMPARG